MDRWTDGPPVSPSQNRTDDLSREARTRCRLRYQPMRASEAKRLLKTASPTLKGAARNRQRLDSRVGEDM